MHSSLLKFFKKALLTISLSRAFIPDSPKTCASPGPFSFLTVLALSLAASPYAWAQVEPLSPEASIEETLPAASDGARKTSSTLPSAAEETGSLQVTDEDLADIQRALAEDVASKASSPSSETSSPSGNSGFFGFFQQNANPNISAVLDVAGSWFSGDGKAITSGGHDPKKTGFTFQQLELSLGHAVDPYFRFDANIVFSQFGVEVEEAYATTLGLPANLQVRLGQFLTRTGRLNPTHPHAWEFVDQAFALTRIFGSEGGRGLGLELSYLLPLPWFAELTLSATDAAGAASARSFLGGGEFDVESPWDFLFAAHLKQFFPLSDAWSLNWGLSALTGPNPTGNDNRTDVYAMDLYLRFRPIDGESLRWLALQAEVFWRRRQIPGDLLQDINAYIQGVWRFSDRWSAAVRYEWGSPSFDTSNHTSDRDFLDPGWTAHRHKVSAAITFLPSEFSRLRLQVARDQAPSLAPDPVWSATLAAEVFVGSHAAHAF